MGDVAKRVEASPYGFALVVAADGTLLGRLRRNVLQGDPDSVAQAVMESGPSTVRPDRECEAVRKRLAERKLSFAVVTDPDGRLLGVVRRAELAEAGPAA
jgi:Mg/Co/Ni transporter MgtE